MAYLTGDRIFYWTYEASDADDPQAAANEILSTAELIEREPWVENFIIGAGGYQDLQTLEITVSIGLTYLSISYEYDEPRDDDLKPGDVIRSTECRRCGVGVTVVKLELKRGETRAEGYKCKHCGHGFQWRYGSAADDDEIPL